MYKQTFTICSCRHTMQAYQLYKDSHGVFVPIERSRRVDVKKQKITVSRQLLMPGILFVPSPQVANIRNKTQAVERFNFRPIYAPLTGLPRLVNRYEIYELQDRLNADFASKRPVSAEPEQHDFEIGDKVQVVGFTSFEGITGTVSKFKSDGKIRVLLNGVYNYLQLDPKNLAKLL